MVAVYSEKEVLNELKDAYLSNKKVMILGYGKHSELRKADIYLHIKMDQFELVNDKVIAYSGASVVKIREEASEKGLLLPTFYDGTVGGLLANNPISPLSTFYGKPIDFTEWVDFATPYKLIRWKGIVGSKGYFGAIIKAQLKLYEKPKRVITYEATIKDKSILLDLTKKFTSYNPLVLLIEYEKEKYQIHATLVQDLEIAGFTKDEGVPNIEESNKNSYYVKTPTVEDFVRFVEKVDPIYAYIVVNSGYSKVYVTDEELISKSGCEYFSASDTLAVYKKLKRIFDFKNIFA